MKFLFARLKARQWFSFSASRVDSLKLLAQTVIQIASRFLTLLNGFIFILMRNYRRRHMQE
jgi:hypothetical protein